MSWIPALNMISSVAMNRGCTAQTALAAVSVLTIITVVRMP